MATAATEVTVVRTRRKGILRRFGEAVLAGVKSVGRTMHRAGRATRRAFGYAYNSVVDAGASVASGVRRSALWIWDRITVVPAIARRVVGWTLRGASWLVQGGLWSITLVLVGILAVVGFVAFFFGTTTVNWDDHVHERTVNMSQGRAFWDKGDLRVREETSNSDETIVVTDVPARPATSPITTPHKTGSQAEDQQSADFTWTLQEMERMVPPANVTEAALEEFWKSVSDQRRREGEKEGASHFYGRALAARAFLREPRDQAIERPDAWYIAQEMRAVDQRNREAGTQKRPELALSKAHVEKGMVDELKRLKELYAKKS